MTATETILKQLTPMKAQVLVKVSLRLRSMKQMTYNLLFLYSLHE